MINLKELLNDFHNTGDEDYEETDNGRWVSTEVEVNGHNFELQSMIQRIPLKYCLMYSDTSSKNKIEQAIKNPIRTALNFQFYYVAPDGEKTQELQNFPGGSVVFSLIKKIAVYLKSKEAEVDTFLFGGELSRRGPYSMFAKIVSMQGWVTAEGEGPGPDGSPAIYFACFKKGT